MLSLLYIRRWDPIIFVIRNGSDYDYITIIYIGLSPAILSQRAEKDFRVTGYQWYHVLSSVERQQRRTRTLYY